MIQAQYNINKDMFSLNQTNVRITKHNVLLLTLGSTLVKRICYSTQIYRNGKHFNLISMSVTKWSYNTCKQRLEGQGVPGGGVDETKVPADLGVWSVSVSLPNL